MNDKNITSYVAKLTPEQIEKLRGLLYEKGWQFEDMPHAHWKSKHDKMTVAAYKSGKLVIQGKDTKDFVLFLLEPLILKKASLGYEDALAPKRKTEFSPHIGIDESGKGDFFGPLVIAAVFVDHTSAGTLEKLDVKDSKLIKSDRKILDIAPKIRRAVAGNFTIVPIGPEAYNRLYQNFKNLNRLLAWGHSRALENLLEKEIDCTWALSDKFGNEKLILNTLFEKGKKIELRQETKAESDIAVAAASILARADFVTRIKKLGTTIGIPLPKGAGSQVLQTAVKIITDQGKEKLNTVSKLHFKTYNNAIKEAAGN